MASPALVARAAGWTPEEAARYQVALLRGLAADRKAQRLYLRKVQIVEMMRTKTTTKKQEGALLEANTKNLDKAAAVAGGRSSSSSGQPTGQEKKMDVENNGMSPDNGKTRLNPTYAHTQGVSGAAGSRVLFFSIFLV